MAILCWELLTFVYPDWAGVTVSLKTFRATRYPLLNYGFGWLSE